MGGNATHPKLMRLHAKWILCLWQKVKCEGVKLREGRRKVEILLCDERGSRALGNVGAERAKTRSLT